MPIRETDLYVPVRDHLQNLGYTVNSEVKDCDITAMKDGELIVVELKTSFNLKLLTQAVRRQRSADSVYVAIPKPKGGKRTAAWRDMCGLLRRLELGLILVDFHKSEAPASIEIILHPSEFDRNKSRQAGRKKRYNIIKEAEARYNEYNTGGSNKRKLMTAYRQDSIHIACCFMKFGKMSPAMLKKLGTGRKTASILSKNFYGWFEKIERGTYGLCDSAKLQVSDYPELVAHFMDLLDSKIDMLDSKMDTQFKEK